MRRLVTLVLVLFLLISLAPYSGAEGERIRVVTTLQIFSSFVKEVGGDLVDVDFIIPQGMDIHSYSLNYEDIEKLDSSDLIVLASSQFFSIDKNIKEKIGNKEILDFENYNATLLPLGNFERNVHGYWLYPSNALNITRAIKEKLKEMDPQNSAYYEENFERFERELTATLETIKEIKKETDIGEKKALLAVPGVFYIVKMLDIPIVGTIVKGPNQFISSQELNEIKKEIERGEIQIIVNAQGLENSKAGEIAIQLSQETGIKVVYVDIFSAENYTNLLIRDTVALGGSSYIYVYPASECNYVPYILTIFVLGVILVILSYAAYHYKRELLK